MITTQIFITNSSTSFQRILCLCLELRYNHKIFQDGLEKEKSIQKKRNNYTIQYLKHPFTKIILCHLHYDLETPLSPKFLTKIY